MSEPKDWYLGWVSGEEWQGVILDGTKKVGTFESLTFQQPHPYESLRCLTLVRSFSSVRIYKHLAHLNRVYHFVIAKVTNVGGWEKISEIGQDFG